jgi:hypothetical protein
MHATPAFRQKKLDRRRRHAFVLALNFRSNPYETKKAFKL